MHFQDLASLAFTACLFNILQASLLDINSVCCTAYCHRLQSKSTATQIGAADLQNLPNITDSQIS